MEMRTRSAVANANGGGVQQLAGSKRRAADESSWNDDQRFTKRFNLLSIDKAAGNGNGNSNLYIPVNNPAAAQNHHTHASTPTSTTAHGSNAPPPDDEWMQVDSTPHRVYIHDLDAELADLSPDSPPPLIFLPDIEQRLSALPRQVLSSPRTADAGNGGQELVLYAPPKSLTAPDDGHDVVRHAILEARQRMQEKAVREARARQEDMRRRYDGDGVGGTGGAEGVVETAHGYSVGYEGEEEGEQEGDGVDPDAMDIG
ncbi:hypothetical protein LTR53_001048 [Teratosphaeriaceae sp. CCFEE 6253]|nr:hypothetical protein LTR53_001048 [Teratosphaeriaceae sp. CCFEE 6253]